MPEPNEDSPDEFVDPLPRLWFNPGERGSVRFIGDFAFLDEYMGDWQAAPLPTPVLGTCAMSPTVEGLMAAVREARTLYMPEEVRIHPETHLGVVRDAARLMPPSTAAVAFETCAGIRIVRDASVPPGEMRVMSPIRVPADFRAEAAALAERLGSSLHSHGRHAAPVYITSEEVMPRSYPRPTRMVVLLLDENDDPITEWDMKVTGDVVVDAIYREPEEYRFDNRIVATGISAVQGLNIKVETEEFIITDHTQRAVQQEG